MAANTAPIYTRQGDVHWPNSAVAVTAANTAKDGTGTIATAFVADATEGGFVQSVRFRAAGTNVATVARLFINNGSATTSAQNNVLRDEITLAATTLSEVAALATYELPLGIALPPGYRLTVTLGTAVAAGYYISTIGGKY
jgi:hypothetical protein